MRAIMIMFDTLTRNYLPNYGNNWVIAPNFQRLEEHCVTFDHFYGGSMPCMPARRELHTGKLNFLYRSWGPLEPFDISVVDVLKNKGIYTHLITDHSHYFEDGGATYHNRYNSWRFFCSTLREPSETASGRRLFFCKDDECRAGISTISCKPGKLVCSGGML